MTTKDEALRLARDALQDAIYELYNWGEYASDYFREKHDFDGVIARKKEQLAAIDAALAEYDAQPAAQPSTGGRP